MAKRGSAPDEALGPVLDGFETMSAQMLEKWQPSGAELPAGLDINLPEPFAEQSGDDIEEPHVTEPVMLVCGICPESLASARLARACGFALEIAAADGETGFESEFADVKILNVSPDFENFVADCEVGRNHFICIFLEDLEACETVLRQCLASDAFYLGLMADCQKRDALFARLASGGAPDAELAAVCCPMGLNVGASTPEQLAVGIVAELLAAQNGTLKKLRHED